MKYRLIALTIFIGILPLTVTAQTPRYARVISQTANLRETPSVSTTASLEITEDTLVKILDEKLPWYVARVGNRVGWMHGDTLEFVSSQPPVVAPPTEQNVSPIYTPSAPQARPRQSTSETSPNSGGYTPPSSSADRGYIRGPRGGCYYISASNRKVYVDRSMCN